uniref:Uncharacterized protein n=1 Tax=Arundo donax TaxID=35708 RepID=A0A0A9FL68_ARUDO
METRRAAHIVGWGHRPRRMEPSTHPHCFCTHLYVQHASHATRTPVRQLAHWRWLLAAGRRRRRRRDGQRPESGEGGGDGDAGHVEPLAAAPVRHRHPLPLAARAVVRQPHQIPRAPAVGDEHQPHHALPLRQQPRHHGVRLPEPVDQLARHGGHQLPVAADGGPETVQVHARHDLDAGPARRVVDRRRPHHRRAPVAVHVQPVATGVVRVERREPRPEEDRAPVARARAGVHHDAVRPGVRRAEVGAVRGGRHGRCPLGQDSLRLLPRVGLRPVLEEEWRVVHQLSKQKPCREKKKTTIHRTDIRVITTRTVTLISIDFTVVFSTVNQR